MSVMLYVCAGSLLYPLSASGPDLQNGYWGSNAFRIAFKLNCPQKNATQEVPRFQLCYFGMIPAVASSIFSYPNFCYSGLTRQIRDANGQIAYGHAPRSIFDEVHDYHGVWWTASEHDVHMSSPVHRYLLQGRISRWFRYLDIFPSAAYLRQSVVFKSLCPLDNGPTAFASATSNDPQVIVNFRITWEAGNRDKATVSPLPYLANLHG